MAQKGKTIAGLGFGVAIGVAFGTLALAPNLPQEVGSGITRSVNSNKEDSEQLEVAQAQLEAGDLLDVDTAHSQLTDTLSDRPVLILATADAENSDVATTRSLLDQAGAIDAGRIDLSENFFTQEGADQLKNIIATTLAAGAQLSEDRLDSGTHAGESLGSVLMLDPETGQEQASVDDRALVLQSLRDANYISYQNGTILPAQAIVFVTGNDDGSQDQFVTSNEAAFAQALRSRGSGVVATGQVRSASDTGLLGKLRSDEYKDSKVSTVDSLERGWAKIAVIQAIREQLDGKVGAYGVAEKTTGPAPGIRRGSSDTPTSESQSEQPSSGEEAPDQSDSEQPQEA